MNLRFPMSSPRQEVNLLIQGGNFSWKFSAKVETEVKSCVFCQEATDCPSPTIATVAEAGDALPTPDTTNISCTCQNTTQDLLMLTCTMPIALHCTSALCLIGGSMMPGPCISREIARQDPGDLLMLMSVFQTGDPKSLINLNK